MSNFIAQGGERGRGRGRGRGEAVWLRDASFQNGTAGGKRKTCKTLQMQCARERVKRTHVQEAV